MILIVVQGGSATGKTTIARKIAHDLGYYLLSKDNFKEMFYDVLGIPVERAESTLYGLAATKALYAAVGVFLDSGKNVIMESAYNKRLALPDINELIADKDIKLIQLYVTAAPEIRLERYNNRIEKGERHEGHPDSIGSVTAEIFAEDDDKYGKLAIDSTVEVNTDNFDDDDYQKLLQTLKNYTKGE